MEYSDLSINLRPTKLSDLDNFFQFQLDEEANYLAAFTPKDPKDKKAYMDKHSRLLDDTEVNYQTIIIGSDIIGSIAKFMMGNDAEITYWIDRNYWGRGIATKALNQFLVMEKTRPIFGRVVNDNYGSQKVLEKCGFTKIGTECGFANARQTVVEKYIYKLM